MFEFILTLSTGKVMLEYKCFLNPLDSNTTENNIKWKSKQFFIWKAWSWKSADATKNEFNIFFFTTKKKKKKKKGKI